LKSSVGMKCAVSVCPARAVRTHPAATVPAAYVVSSVTYTKVPGASAVAFNCAAPSGVPNTMSVGCGHVTVGEAFSTVSGTVAVVAS
jgi:hypothetical protein